MFLFTAENLHDEMVVSLMDSDVESGNHSLTHSEVVVSEGDPFTPAKRSSLSSSSSSSSSDSSFDGDFFQLNDSKLDKPNISVDLVSKENEGEVLGKPSSITAESYPSPSGSKNVTNGVSFNNVESYSSSSGSESITTEASPNFEESDSDSPRSQQILDKAQFDTRDSNPGYPGSDGIPREVDFDSGESDLGSPDSISTTLSVQSGSVMQSPPIQVMERPNDTSTYRIPASVFARSTTTPVEWSVASNESLFSIHVGNNSFSRDQFILMDKSGELGKSSDLFYLKTEDYMLSNCPPPPLPVMGHEKKSPDLGDSLGVDEAAAETMKEVLRANAEDQNKAKPKFAEETRTSSHRSDGSGASIYSFAFPMRLTSNFVDEDIPFVCVAERKRRGVLRYSAIVLIVVELSATAHGHLVHVLNATRHAATADGHRAPVSNVNWLATAVNGHLASVLVVFDFAAPVRGHSAIALILVGPAAPARVHSATVLIVFGRAATLHVHPVSVVIIVDSAVIVHGRPVPVVIVVGRASIVRGHPVLVLIVVNHSTSVHGHPAPFPSVVGVVVTASVVNIVASFQTVN
ncbi:hypothetical protein FRX31_004598 [Thalictrum thalictroides]|uniref:Uncharacterized protein n=1 Tax=Thalictrum thalictroides TaxID=46969 RepID=A0A7J6X7W8_THATH|nr:hypothetical protein FRX31_004598 [Thalictrum thalictroides]